jgi:hypothetical protein
MTQVYGILDTEYKFTSSVEPGDEGCEFVLEKADWEHKHPTDVISDEWHCPYESESNSEYCLIHQPIDKKNKNRVEEWVRTLLAENPDQDLFPLFGGKFEELDVGSLIPKNSVKYTALLFQNCEFYGGIALSRSELRVTVDFTGSIFFEDFRINDLILRGDLILDDTRFYSGDADDPCLIVFNSELDGDVSFEGSIFHSPIHMTESSLKDDFSAKSAIFCSMATFQMCEFHNEAIFSRAKFTDDLSEYCASFYDSQFMGQVSLMKSKFFGSSTWQDAEFESDLLFTHSSFDDTLHLHRIDVQGNLSLSNTELPSLIDLNNTHIAEIQLSRVEVPSTGTRINFLESHIAKGKLLQPNAGKLYSDFSGGEIGDVKFSPDRSLSLLNPFEHIFTDNKINDNPFKFSRFFKTRFSGFQFGDYDAYFEDLDWTIHEIRGKDLTQVSYEFQIERGDEKEETIEVGGEVMKPSALASTYLSAKNGAADVGDEVASSRFFIKEMEYRRKYYWRKLIDSTQNGSISGRIFATLNWGSRWLINIIWKMFGYGEKVWLISVYILFVIMTSGLIYPAIGGIEINNQVLDYSKGSISKFGYGEILVQSLYFSLTTFTAFGYGDYLPNGELSQSLAIFESLSGIFLIPLLIFTLGRKVSR